MNSYSTSWWSLLLIYRPREDERLSWPCWLTYSRRFTHINGYPSAADPVHTSESSPVRDRRSTTEPPNQQSNTCYCTTCMSAMSQSQGHCVKLMLLLRKTRQLLPLMLHTAWHHRIYLIDASWCPTSTGTMVIWHIHCTEWQVTDGQYVRSIIHRDHSFPRTTEYFVLSHGICPFPQNFYVFAEFGNFRVHPVDLRYHLIDFRIRWIDKLLKNRSIFIDSIYIRYNL